MTITILTLVSLLSAFSVIWLIHYVPLTHKVFGVCYSPRLLVCKLLIPFDISITLVLIIGGILGLMSAIGGIQSLVYSTFVAAGVSLGVYVMHKIVIPRWRRVYEIKRKQLELAI